MASDTGTAAARPTLSRDEFRTLVASLGFRMTPNDEDDYLELVREMEADVNAVEALPAYTDPWLAPVTDVAARAYHVPQKKDNPFHAWSHQFTIKDDAAAASGLLGGRTIALKDTVSVAGIPLTLGTGPFQLTTDQPYPVPDVDAPVVRRLLESGAVVAGTSTCEFYCMSGMSDTSATGPVDNPWLPGFSAGGSSSGSAVLTALQTVRAWRTKRGLPVGELGEGVDFAVGGDQGGSIRLPAAYCGIYGLKPTHGLVPYTGIAALHPIADHAGPMAASLADVALLLSAMAGHDDMDPRAAPGTPLRASVPAYHTLLREAVAARAARGEWTPATAGRGLRVGLLTEALASAMAAPAVVDVVRAAAARFARLGAAVVDVSVPLHRHAGAIWTATMRGAMADVFLDGRAPDLVGYTSAAVPPPARSQAWYDATTAASPMVVASLLGSAYLGADPHRPDVARFPPRLRSKALHHALELRRAYDAALADVDVLLLPVTPDVAQRHLPPGAATRVRDVCRAHLGVSANTSPFNVTGHPALAMPGGWGPAADGTGRLPVGIQLVGRHHDEVGVLLAASIWEVAGHGLDND